MGLLWPSDQLVAEAATHTTHNKDKTQETNIVPSPGFEPAIQAIKGIHTYYFGRGYTGARTDTTQQNQHLSGYTLPERVATLKLTCVSIAIATQGLDLSLLIVSDVSGA
jgi:hypothetical protein